MHPRDKGKHGQEEQDVVAEDVILEGCWAMSRLPRKSISEDQLWAAHEEGHGSALSLRHRGQWGLNRSWPLSSSSSSSSSCLNFLLAGASEVVSISSSSSSQTRCIETLAEFSTPENHQRIDEVCAGLRQVFFLIYFLKPALPALTQLDAYLIKYGLLTVIG